MPSRPSKTEPPLPTVNMLWIGEGLGPIERLSITSFLRIGHPVHLHAYTPLKNVPVGTVLCDANHTVPWSKAGELQYANGSYALASNYFRYALQAQGKGMWCDADLVCLKPFEINGDHLFAWEDEIKVNCGVFYLQQDHPLLHELLDLYETEPIPPWAEMNVLRRWIARRRAQIRGKPLGRYLPWGAYGVNAFNALSKKYPFTPMPSTTFYSLRWRQAHRLVDPHEKLEDLLAPDSRALHLWHEVLRRESLLRKPPPATSPLAELYRRYGIA